MKRLSLVSHALLAGLVLSGCSGYRPAPAAFHEMLDQPYRLGAGDRIRVTVFEQAELTNTYSVDQSGYFAFPLVGAVPARGHTAQQIEATLAAKLREGYLRDPDVSVEIDRYRPIFVMGEVGAAGQYSYVPGLTVQKAIAIAGGFTPRANQGSADITRDINGKVITGRVRTSDPLLPGDTIYVRERLF
ncbi:polysaccharide biosynthesis/export family protein [Mesorhizobium sp. KR9-304]|uniref:polysaccharide biosynthesis/export family protein n=1 Tax=Mesorhizobium sp. KR9-304 TaxID=3156614 RepID=UPI0032B59BAC